MVSHAVFSSNNSAELQVGLPASQFAVESLVSGFDSNSFSTSVAEESFSYTRRVMLQASRGTWQVIQLNFQHHQQRGIQ
jgi:hypothetical protein